MLIIYRFLINFILLISPIIFILRFLKKKESLKSYFQKIGFFSKKIEGRLIWFHGASVGEIESIIPLIQKFEKNEIIDQILITTNTLSSATIINKYQLRKTFHQFFPIDSNLIIKKFLDHWKPKQAFFVDSEIWPNIIFELDKRKIPIKLLNGRISINSYKRWKIFKNFSDTLFSKFDLCLSSNQQTLKFLKKLNSNNVKYIGNLKYSQSNNEKFKIKNKLKKIFNKKKIWCAASTHANEERICGYTHLALKKKYKNLLTIIIPRHIERCKQIKNDLENLGLRVYLDVSNENITNDVDIYLINSYGKTKFFFNYVKNVFLGGSIIKHGGQNPLEPARFGCNIIYGPHVFNFKEVYAFLNKNNISKKIYNQKQLQNYLNTLFKKDKKRNKISKRLQKIGKKILNETYNEIIMD